MKKFIRVSLLALTLSVASVPALADGPGHGGGRLAPPSPAFMAIYFAIRKAAKF